MVTVYHAKNTRSIRVLWTLEELGVKPGEHVALLLPNVPQFTVHRDGRAVVDRSAIAQ